MRRRNWAAAHAQWRRNDWEHILFNERKVTVDITDKRQHTGNALVIHAVERWIVGVDHPL